MLTSFSSISINRDGERIPVSSAIRKGFNKIYDYYGASGVIDKIDKYIFNDELLLIGEDGANLLTRSKPIAFIAMGKYWVNNHAHVIDAVDKITLKWLCYFINAIDLSPFVTGSAQPKITQDNLHSICVPLPPLSEQHRIVAAIESAFAVIDEIERNKTDLQAAVAAAKSKILSLAIRGKLVPQDPNDEPASALLERIRAEHEVLIKAGKIKRGKNDNTAVRSCDNSYYENVPQGWVICSLSAVGQIVGGGTPRTDESLYWDNGSIPWITPADLSGYTDKSISSGTRMITQKGLSESSAQLLPKGSILFSSRAPIGYTVIAANEVCTNQGFKSVSPYIEGISDYLYYYLKSQVEEIRARASGTTFKEISGTEMSKTTLFLPPLAEQKRIVTAIEKSFAWLDEIAVNIS